jgi:hypothetical protein
MLRTVFSISAIALLCTACSVEPWVKPYERDHMADPIMSLDRNPVATSYLAHVYGVREGSRGGQGGNGGGCGCN